MGTDLLQQRLVRAGAWLFTAGLVTGVWAAAVLTDTVVVAVPRLALAAHLNGLLGGLWLIAVAVTLDRLRYGLTGRRRLALFVLVATWANWLITLVASALGVRWRRARARARSRQRRKCERAGSTGARASAEIMAATGFTWSFVDWTRRLFHVVRVSSSIFASTTSSSEL